METLTNFVQGGIEIAAQKIDGNHDKPAYFSGLTSVEAAGAAIATYNLLYMDGTAKELLLADADAAGKAPAICMALDAGADGGKVPVLWQGRVRNSAWSWTEGGLIYLSDTPGALTQTPPATAGDIVQIVGVALSATEVWFNPQLNTDVVPQS